MEYNLVANDVEAMICHYADLRVSPYGVVSLEERMADLAKRYVDRYTTKQDRERWEFFASMARQLEMVVLAQSDLSNSDLNDEKVATRRVQLEKMEWKLR